MLNKNVGFIRGVLFFVKLLKRLFEVNTEPIGLYFFAVFVARYIANALHSISYTFNCKHFRAIGQNKLAPIPRQFTSQNTASKQFGKMYAHDEVFTQKQPIRIYKMQ